MAITKVPSDMIQVANNVTDTTVGGANTGFSLTFDSLGVISAAANVALAINTADIADGSITTAKIADANVTVGKLATTVAGALGVRNLIINGDMRIAQRGTSATGLTGAGYHTVDRFLNNIAAAGTWTSTQDADVPSGQGFAKSHKLTCTTATASPVVLAMEQLIEGQNLQHLKKGTANAESVTLSFWVKSNKTGTYIIELYDTDNTRNISQAYTINSADTWEKKTLTFAGDTTGVFNNDNGKSLEVYWWLGANATYSGGTLNTSWSSAVNANRAVGVVNLADAVNNYINITGVQLEVGTEATPFEHRPYDMELARCQRYYYSMGGNSAYEHFASMSQTSATDCRGLIYLPVPMRTVPSVYQSGSFMASSYNVALTGTYSSGSTMYFSGTSSFGGIQNFGFDFYSGTAGSFTVNNGAMWILRANNSTSTRLGFNAEL